MNNNYHISVIPVETKPGKIIIRNESENKRNLQIINHLLVEQKTPEDCDLMIEIRVEG